MAGVDVDQHAALKAREHRLANRAGQIPQQVGAADQLQNLGPALAELLRGLDFLHVESLGIQEQRASLAQPVIAHPVEEDLDSPAILALVAAGKQRLEHLDIVTQVYQSERDLQEPGPMPAAVGILGQRVVAENDPSAGHLTAVADSPRSRKRLPIARASIRRSV